MAYPGPEDLNYSEGLPRILTYVNDITSSFIPSMFSNILIIAIFIIITATIYRTRNNIIEAFALSSFSTFIVALLFFLGGFIVGPTLVIIIGFMLLSILALFIDKK